MGRRARVACVQELQSCQSDVRRWPAAVCALRPAGPPVRGDGQARQARVHQLQSRQGEVRPRR